MKIRFLNRQDILALTQMKEINDLSARLFRDLSSGKLKVPQRIHLDSMENSTSLIMPAYSETEKLFSVKVVNLALGNPSRQLPLLHGLLLLADSETGIPFALMDAGIITAIRTGAAGGLAVRLFSHPDSEVLALIGAGIQSEWQFRAAIVERPIKKVFVFNTNPEKAKQFCHKLKQEFETDIIPAQDQSLLAEADIICTATTSATPVIHHNALNPHVHINAIGSYKPDVQEIPEEIVRKSVIIVDRKEAAIHETGDLIIPIKKGIIRQEDVLYEIGELVGKETDTLKKSRTLFKSVGNAAQDLYVGYWIFQKAVQAGMGKEIEM